MEKDYAGFPFKLVVHFRRGRTVVVAPQKIVSENDGEDIDSFIEKYGS